MIKIQIKTILRDLKAGAFQRARLHAFPLPFPLHRAFPLLPYEEVFCVMIRGEWEKAHLLE